MHFATFQRNLKLDFVDNNVEKKPSFSHWGVFDEISPVSKLPVTTYSSVFL